MSHPSRTRCVDGRLMRHDPQPDDPYLETDIGECGECEGVGCETCEACEGTFRRDEPHAVECFETTDLILCADCWADALVDSQKEADEDE